MEEDTDLPVDDPDCKRVEKAICELAEHFDAVLLMVSRSDGGEEGTLFIVQSKGNNMACYGLAKEYVFRREEFFKSKGPL